MGDPNSTGVGAYAPATWIGLTEDGNTPLATDTTLPGEIASGAFSRAQGSFAHTTGASTYTLTKVFSADQEITPRKLGIFTAQVGGTMVFETLIADPDLVHVGDQYQVIPTVTLTP